MKRHASLAPLSREHHGALILAQLLKNSSTVYRGLPSDSAGKANYAISFYQEELVKHFKEEEKIVIGKIGGIDASLDALAGEIIAEHKELGKLFGSIKEADDLPAHLEKIGHVLEQHIRKEERVFFPLIEMRCPAKLLSEIEAALST
jgi:iron-sulfur cluster repair protein YtfE (RIC family)